MPLRKHFGLLLAFLVGLWVRPHLRVIRKVIVVRTTKPVPVIPRHLWPVCCVWDCPPGECEARKKYDAMVEAAR